MGGRKVDGRDMGRGLKNVLFIGDVLNGCPKEDSCLGLCIQESRCNWLCF